MEFVKLRYLARFFCTLAIFCMAFLSYQLALAQTAEELQSQIKEKQQRVKEIDSLIGTYRKKIQSQQGQMASLQNQILLLDNQIQEKELSIQRAQAQIDALTLEVRMLENEIAQKGASIMRQKELIGELVRKINQSDTTTPLEILLSKKSLSEYFAASEELQKINNDLGQTVSQLQTVKLELEAKKADQIKKKTEVEKEKSKLKEETFALEGEKNFKESLVLQTQNNENTFQRILYELRQQEQGVSTDVSKLERQLKEQLASADKALAQGDTLFSWPVDPSAKGISAIFHDPTYPFRNLFEHPGLDLPQRVGTQVHAAAGGYVAWTKTGPSYGNYMMIIHTNGLATVYAHLSKFIVKADTFVSRGDVIGLSGGAPGAQGAGLSTGPHLHFEIRKDGIPTNPEKYLPQVPDDYYIYYGEYKDLGIKL